MTFDDWTKRFDELVTPLWGAPWDASAPNGPMELEFYEMPEYRRVRGKERLNDFKAFFVSYSPAEFLAWFLLESNRIDPLELALSTVNLDQEGVFEPAGIADLRSVLTTREAEQMTEVATYAMAHGSEKFNPIYLSHGGWSRLTHGVPFRTIQKGLPLPRQQS